MFIQPTVGRIVWYWPRRLEGYKADQAQAAIVTFVHPNGLVNLTAFTPTGVPVPRLKVYLAQEGVEHPFVDNFAQWMPYQVGQAKKHSSEEKAS